MMNQHKHSILTNIFIYVVLNKVLNGAVIGQFGLRLCHGKVESSFKQNEKKRDTGNLINY